MFQGCSLIRNVPHLMLRAATGCSRHIYIHPRVYAYVEVPTKTCWAPSAMVNRSRCVAQLQILSTNIQNLVIYYVRRGIVVGYTVEIKSRLM